MVDYITTYKRDGKEVSSEEWNKMLKEDIEKDVERFSFIIGYKDAIYTDLSNGRDIELNGHYYETRTNSLYDSAKDLLDNLMFEGKYDVILKVLKEMPETEILNIVSRMKCINVKDGKLLLKDEKDW